MLIAPALLGRPLLDLAACWDRMYELMRPRGHALRFMLEALNGVDIALHDLAGKLLGVPCAVLLGGFTQRRVRTYASVLQWLAPDDLATVAQQHRDASFTAMKLKVGQDPLIDRRKVEATRRAVGDSLQLMSDANCRYTVPEAVTMGRILEEHNVRWFEEPLPPEDVNGYHELRGKLGIAIAGGECECTHYRFATLLAQRTFDVLQPDICRAGGLTACHRIGLLASAHNALIAPHVSIGSAIHIAASLHWATSERVAFIHEYPVFPNPLVDDLLTTPLDWREGYLHLSDAPGLGIEIRDNVVARYRTA